MAVTPGTNSGFVTSAPSGDPAGSNYAEPSGYGVSFKESSGTNSGSITEIGWYANKATFAGGAYEAALYSHDAANDKPNVPIGSIKTGQSITANTPGWYKYTGISDITISSSTSYWHAISVAAGLSPSPGLYYNNVEGYRYCWNSGASLPSSGGWTLGATDRPRSIYSLVSAGGASAVPANRGNVGMMLGMSNAMWLDNDFLKPTGGN